MKDTLSTLQWQHLQHLFEQADALDADAAAALVESTRASDAHVADALMTMLAAHHRWRARTGDAIEHLTRATQVSAIGTRLGAYNLVSEIGRGGMGVVYLAERVDGQVQQQVAIKVLHTSNLDDNARARFQREREILAAFDHPGIARLFDAGESTAGEPYYVMELIHGKPVTDYCDDRKLSIRQRLQLFLDVCGSVQYAHGKLVLHRDIKPSNVLVDTTGIPKLIDFGIAKPIHLSGNEAIAETAAQHRYFSPVNAAPEQVRGESAAVTCDVYQLGTLLYELLCGSPLFDLRGKTAAQIEQLICDLPPRPPSENVAQADAALAYARNLPGTAALRRQLRGDLDAIALRAVRKEPGARYASAEQLSADVGRYLDNLPVHGRRGTTLYRLGRFTQRHWRSLTVAFTAVLGLVIFAALLIHQQRQTALERDNAVTERDRGKAVTDFLIDIFRDAGPSTTGGPETPIRTALKKGEELLELRTTMDPRTRARLLGTLSIINVNLSDLDTGEAQILKAVQLLESEPAIDPLLLADHYQQASGLLHMRGNVERAAVMAKHAVALFQAQGADVSRSWYAQLSVLRAERDVDEHRACAGLEKLLRETSPLIETTPEAFAGILKFTLSCRPDTAQELARSESELRKSIAHLSNRSVPNDLRILQMKQRLSTVLTAQHRLDESAAVLGEILPQQERIFGPASWSVAFTLAGMGNIAYERNDYAQAEQLLSRSQAIFLAVHKGRPSADLASAAYFLARVYHFGHHDLAKAREFYVTALEMSRTTFGPRTLEVGTFSANYGALLLRSGDVQLAEPLLRDAVAIVPKSNRAGVRARIALATIHATRDELSRASELLSEANHGIADVVREDPAFATEVQHLRTRLESAGPAITR